MRHIPRSLRPLVLASALALLAGCESMYEGPSHNTADKSSVRDDRATGYESRYGDRAAPAAASETRVTVDRAGRNDSNRAASNSGAGGGSGATRVSREGDRVRYTMAYPTGDRNSSVMLVEKTLPSQVRVGQPFEYELKVTNITDATLDDVRLQEQSPEGLAITASQPERKGEGADAGWELGALKPNES